MQNKSELACVAGDAKTEGGIRRERRGERESGGGGGGGGHLNSLPAPLARERFPFLDCETRAQRVRGR